MTHAERIDYPAEAVLLCRKIADTLQSIGDPLVSTASLVGQDGGLRAIDASVVVGRFRTTGSQTRDVGVAVSDTLQILLADLPAIGLPALLRQPSIHPRDVKFDSWVRHYRSDQWLSTETIITRYARVNGVADIVQGEVDANSTTPSLSLTHRNIDSNRAPSQVRLEANDHVMLIAQAMTWILQQIGITLDEAQQQLITAQLDESQFMTYVDVLTELHANGWTVNHRLSERLEGNRFLPLEYLRLFLKPQALFEEPVDVYARYDHLESTFNAHTDLLIMSWRREPDHDELNVDRDIAQRMLNRLKKQPDNIKLAIDTAQALCVAELYRQAVALSMALVEALPGHYRSWWTLGYTLKELAWDFRGEDWAYNVSDAQRDAFATLLELAIEATDTALSLHPSNPALVHLRLMLESGCSETLLNLLERSIELDPTFTESYETALNFSMPRWGGSLSVQMWIVAEAIKHNPTERWPITFYKDYIASNDDYTLLTRLKLMLARLNRRWPENVLDWFT